MLTRNAMRALTEAVTKVVEEFKEHDPGEHRQAIEVTVEALVLAHDVARGFEQRSQRLGGGGGLGLVGWHAQ